jgi:hypothetical protein
MIRIVLIATMVCVLGIVLYVPSAVPPDRLLEIIRSEHVVNARIWNAGTADRILQRMLDFQAGTPSASAPPHDAVVAQGPGVNTAMANEVGQMSARLFGSPYFRSIDALFALAALRISALLQMLPLLIVFMLVCVIDGVAVRSVRAREFSAHSAELYTASSSVGILLFAVVLVCLFLPWSLSPLYLTAALLLMFFVFSRAVANYHVIR